MGVSADSPGALEEFTKKNTVKHLLLADPGRKMLAAYGALVTDKKSPIYGYGKRVYSGLFT